jgi:tRNA-Thr(GGU) m(6)t(6)A37 methyltransferase TsaA
MTENDHIFEPVGVVRSELVSLADAPLQGDEDSYEAWLEIMPQFVQGLHGIQIGDELIILTWLHLAHRDVLQVHPRRQVNGPLVGVFATRSPDRPNPIGLHQVSVLQIVEQRLRVAPIEAVDGTPILDIKPVLRQLSER